jgi:hypothetical protein
MQVIALNKNTFFIFEQVSGQSASSFRGPTRSRRKFKNTNLGPTKTFYYDTPPEMYKNLPMNPVQVSFNVS